MQAFNVFYQSKRKFQNFKKQTKNKLKKISFLITSKSEIKKMMKTCLETQVQFYQAWLLKIYKLRKYLNSLQMKTLKVFYNI